MVLRCGAKNCVPSCPGSPLRRSRMAAAAAIRVPSVLQGPGAVRAFGPGGKILCPGASVRLSRPFVMRYGFPFLSPVSPPPREGRGMGPVAGLRPPMALAMGPPGCTLIPGGLPASLHCTGESRPRQAHRFSGAALTFPGALEAPQGRSKIFLDGWAHLCYIVGVGPVRTYFDMFLSFECPWPAKNPRS